jgi:putative sigma-54 modulation protein
MDIIIETPGFTVGDGIEDLVREKIGRLDKEGNIVRVDVTLFLGPDSSPARCHCEIRLEVPGNDLFVKRNANEFERAIVEATDVLRKNFHRMKEKNIERNRGGAPDDVVA